MIARSHSNITVFSIMATKLYHPTQKKNSETKWNNPECLPLREARGSAHNSRSYRSKSSQTHNTNLWWVNVDIFIKRGCVGVSTEPSVEAVTVRGRGKKRQNTVRKDIGPSKLKYREKGKGFGRWRGEVGKHIWLIGTKRCKVKWRNVILCTVG